MSKKIRAALDALTDRIFAYGPSKDGKKTKPRKPRKPKEN